MCTTPAIITDRDYGTGTGLMEVTMVLAIGVDVGGTKVAAGVVDEVGKVLAMSRRDTPVGAVRSEIEDLISEAVRELLGSHAVGLVGIGAAGFVSADRSTVLFAPNLSWRDEPLGRVIQRRVGLPTVVENDANAAAWAEARFGAGAGESNVVVITVGTGIGGGIIIDGKLRRGRFGLAGEIGHLSVVADGRRCGCGNQGCWEQYCSGRALVAEARRLATGAPERAEVLLALADGRPGAITGPMVTTAAQAGDHVAVQAFRIIGDWLGRGMADLATILDPGTFVLAGGVSHAGELLREPAWQSFRGRLTGREHRPIADVRTAQLGGDEAGVIGAADLARQV
jgi:glucokinase